MGLVNYINKRIQKSAKKNLKKRTWSYLSFEWLDFFNDQPNGFFICNLRAPKTNLLSRLIGIFQNGYSHTVLLFKGDISNYLTFEQIQILNSKYIEIYKNPPYISKSEVIVWGSADMNGINWFDFSAYQNRGMTIYQPEYLKGEFYISNIIKESFKYLWKPYDATGLMGWLLYKYISKVFRFFDDKKSLFCSEYCYDLIKKSTGYKIAHKDNPGPGDIHCGIILDKILDK